MTVEMTRMRCLAIGLTESRPAVTLSGFRIACGPLIYVQKENPILHGCSEDHSERSHSALS